MRKRQIPLVVIGVVLLAVIVALAIFLYQFSNEQFIKASHPLKYSEFVEKYADEFDVPPSLIYGVIRSESSFRPDAVSHADAKGLMQLTDDTFEWTLYRLGETEGDVFDPETNIRCGTKLLQYLLRKFEKEETALAAYNAGVETVEKWLADPACSTDGKTLHTIPYGETREYVKRVAQAKTTYQALYGIA